jgi:hypothetical protein
MPSPLARSRGALLAGVVAATACLAVATATPREAFWIVDCGHKALVAQRLLETGFTELGFDYPAEELDPEGQLFPMGDWAVRRGEGFVSIFPAAYPALAAPFLGWLGPAGLRVPAALGVGACAWLFALWLAPALGQRWAAGGGITLGLATPLFFYGVTVWEHSLTVALSLASWVVLSRPGVRRALAAGILIGAACWLREELVLMGVALACASLLCWRRLSIPAALAVGAAVPIAGLLAFNAHVYGDPLGPHFTVNLAGGAGAGGLNAAAREHLTRQLQSLLAGLGESPTEAKALAWTTLGAFAIGWAAGRRRAGLRAPALPNSARLRLAARALRALPWLLSAVGLGAWLLGFSSVLRAESPLSELVLYNGLLVQMPLVAASGLGLSRVWRDPATVPLRVGAVAGLLFLPLAIASGLTLALAFGFGVHWGPRQILPGLPALAALFLVAARDDPSVPRAAFALPRVATISLIAAGLLSSAQATWLLAQQKAEGTFLQNRILARPADVVVTTNPLLAQHLAPLWQRKRMLLVQTDTQLAQLVRHLASHEIRELLLLLPPSSPVLAGIPGIRCRRAGEHRGSRVHYHDLDLQECEVTPRTTAREG